MIPRWAKSLFKLSVKSSLIKHGYFNVSCTIMSITCQFSSLKTRFIQLNKQSHWHHHNFNQRKYTARFQSLCNNSLQTLVTKTITAEHALPTSINVDHPLTASSHVITHTVNQSLWWNAGTVKTHKTQQNLPLFLVYRNAWWDCWRHHKDFPESQCYVNLHTHSAHINCWHGAYTNLTRLKAASYWCKHMCKCSQRILWCELQTTCYTCAYC